jgi:hypothetical protein
LYKYNNILEQKEDKLYAIYYLGVNKNLFDDINDFKKNLDKLGILNIIKYVSFVFNALFLVFSGILISKDIPILTFVLGIICQIFVIFYIIINSICLKINKKYIKKFLNQINFYFERNQCDSIWTILLIVIGIIFFLYYIFIFVYKIISSDKINQWINNFISNPNENNQQRNSVASIPSGNNQQRNSVGSIPIGNNQQRNSVASNPNGNNQQRNSVGSNSNGNNPLIIRYVPIGGQESKEPVKELEQIKKEEEEKFKEDKKTEEEEKQHICVICLTNEAKAILCPCGHKCVCETCFNVIFFNSDKKCPICQQNILGKFSSQNNP